MPWCAGGRKWQALAGDRAQDATDKDAVGVELGDHAIVHARHIKRPLGTGHDGVWRDDIDEVRSDELLLRQGIGVDQWRARVVLLSASSGGGIRRWERSCVAVDARSEARSYPCARHVNVVLLIDIDSTGRADSDIELAVVRRSGRADAGIAVHGSIVERWEPNDQLPVSDTARLVAHVGGEQAPIAEEATAIVLRAVRRRLVGRDHLADFLIAEASDRRPGEQEVAPAGGQVRISLIGVFAVDHVQPLRVAVEANLSVRVASDAARCNGIARDHPLPKEFVRRGLITVLSVFGGDSTHLPTEPRDSW